MRDPKIELRADHLLIHLEGRAAALAPHKDVVVPFSDIVEAHEEAPRWPSMAGQWQIAAYLPRVVAVGDFHDWDGTTRLLAFDRDTRHTLTLRLAGHPDFDEIRVQCDDATGIANAVSRHSSATTPWSGPAPRE